MEDDVFYYYRTRTHRPIHIYLFILYMYTKLLL